MFLYPKQHGLCAAAGLHYLRCTVSGNNKMAEAAQLSLLRRPDGGSIAIVPGSYGNDIILTDPAPVRRAAPRP